MDWVRGEQVVVWILLTLDLGQVLLERHGQRSRVVGFLFALHFAVELALLQVDVKVKLLLISWFFASLLQVNADSFRLHRRIVYRAGQVK